MISVTKKTLKQQFCTSRPSPDLESPNAGNTLGSNGHLFKTKKLYILFSLIKIKLYYVPISINQFDCSVGIWIFGNHVAGKYVWNKILSFGSLQLEH